MRSVSLTAVLVSWIVFATGCGDGSSPSSETGGTAALVGGTGGTGGVGLGGTELGGAEQGGTGATPPETGGMAATGGAAAGGGGTGTGGNAVGGGGTGTGGNAVGGGGTGGDPGNGGSGGSSTGGDLGSGGATGGAAGTGGDAAGGDSGTGGDGTGGGLTGSMLVTSGPNEYWITDAPVTELASGTADLSVDENTTYQRWDGFGGTFNEMGWDALSVVSSEITRALTLLFDAENGANFVYGRIPIGASDYSMDWYTLAETANDYSMDNFSIARDREMLIPYIKAALAIKPDLNLWGSPWVVPDWMMDGSRNMRSDAQTLEAHALYLAKFVEEYAKEGITIEAVHPQNEPGYARVHWAQSVLIDYFKTYLGPKFVEEGLTAEVWCGTMSHPDDADIATAVANDPEAMQYVTGFGLQWNHVDTVALLAPMGPVMQTEHRCGNYNFTAPYWDQSRYDPNTPQNDHLYGEESWQLIRDWIVGGVNSYLAWNMVLDTQGRSLDGWPQNALLVVDRSAQTLTATPAYYVFRHYSQYIAPGATRIGTSGTDDALAFKNPDGRIVTEVYNSGDSSQQMTVGVRGALYQFAIPAHGWATLVTP